MKKTNLLSRALLATITYAALSLSGAHAGAQDYEFQLFPSEVKTGPAAEVSVRLVDKRTGSLVSDAVIFTTRMDMAPEGMEMMATPVEELPSSQPGTYKFKTNLSMEGGWRFQIGAKVQGEGETVNGEVVVKATP
ncbi:MULTISPECIES: FixH family protein [Rhizobium]|uniref:FixH family protein n=1 Tax=Rhizobium TaxID=379 RepID=UPI0011064C25|nr:MULTISPECIES: FixH family protein [Rhizobium]MBX4869666.1 FixH family protein [Rhizobium bangladeshense]MBX4890909.1 FixH family protein [Rhizobium bangladeshense]MBX4894995.1 FixH family protein [Rhizobium bangladeshense]MBX4903910.1 FixH family protein [Rhizobium bangladeshense]MBX4916378.1 FixH family protein [Rhizobium bangladeshense]